MQSIIIAAFRGTGKTWCARHYKKGISSLDREETFEIIDLDIVHFKWIGNAEKEKERNLNFPMNYVYEIKNLRKEENKIILISADEEVLEILNDEGIHLIIVRPNVFSKVEYVERFKNMKIDKDVIDKVSDEWNILLCNISEYKNLVIFDKEKRLYLSDVIEYLRGIHFTIFEFSGAYVKKDSIQITINK